MWCSSVNCRRSKLSCSKHTDLPHFIYVVVGVCFMTSAVQPFPKPYYVPVIHVLQPSNISPSPASSPLSMYFSLTCTSFSFLRSEVTLTCFLLTYWQSFPSCSNKQKVISTTTSSTKVVHYSYLDGISCVSRCDWYQSHSSNQVTTQCNSQCVNTKTPEITVGVWHGSVFWRHCHHYFHVKSRSQLSVSNIFTLSL